MKLLVTGSSGFVGRRFLEMAPIVWACLSQIVSLGTGYNVIYRIKKV